MTHEAFNEPSLRSSMLVVNFVKRRYTNHVWARQGTDDSAQSQVAVTDPESDFEISIKPQVTIQK